MKLHNIIKENIKLYLLESLKTQKEKYGNELVDKLKSIDPSKTYKYIDQICKFYNEGASRYSIKTQIDIYNDKLNKNLIDKEYRDINKFKNFNEFKNYVNNIENIKSRTEIKKQYGDLNSPLAKKQYWKTIITEKGTWDIYIPETVDESIQIQSKDTRWCTQMENKNKNYFNKYRFIDRYSFYYVVNQNGEKYKITSDLIDKNQNWTLMFQIRAFSYPRSPEIWDNIDDKIGSTKFKKITGLEEFMFKYIPPKDGIYDIMVFDNRYIITYKNGKYNGKFIKYYENGNKELECNYRNDKLNGKYIEYYENGNIKEKIYYRNGKFSGKYIEYYKDGSIEKCSIYKNGIKIENCDGE